AALFRHDATSRLLVLSAIEGSPLNPGYHWPGLSHLGLGQWPTATLRDASSLSANDRPGSPRPRTGAVTDWVNGGASGELAGPSRPSSVPPACPAAPRTCRPGIRGGARTPEPDPHQRGGLRSRTWCRPETGWAVD